MCGSRFRVAITIGFPPNPYTMIASGNGAMRQRALFAETRDERAVMADLVTRTRESAREAAAVGAAAGRV